MAGKGRRGNKVKFNRILNIDPSVKFSYYFELLKKIAISKYTWNNLPDSVDQRFIELTLFNQGQALFFKDEIIDEYICLENQEMGRPNIYGIPNYRRGVGCNGYNVEKDWTNSVLIYNDRTHSTPASGVSFHADNLAMLSIIKEINIGAQRTPFVIKCTEQQRLTFLNLWRQYVSNEPLIMTSKGLSMDDFTTIPTMAPYVADKIEDAFEMEWNRAMTFLGVSNVPTFKKERVNTSETLFNVERTYIIRKSELDERNEAAKKIMKMFGLKNIYVDYTYYALNTEMVERGGEIGNLYNSYSNNSGKSEQTDISSGTIVNSQND